MFSFVVMSTNWEKPQGYEDRKTDFQNLIGKNSWNNENGQNTSEQGFLNVFSIVQG